MDIKKLTEITDKILEVNDDVLISGSLALNILNIKTRREPNDIDLYLKYGKVFTPIEGMVKYHYETDADYENIYYEQKAFKLGEIKIDVFTPFNEDGECGLPDDQCSECLASHVIIGFKSQYSLGESGSRYKHRDDIIHILINN